METATLGLIISVIALLLAISSIYLITTKKKEKASSDFNTVPLQLQAYERMVMLCERIAIPNLISRVNLSQLSAKEMQVVLLENIKQEFEYNTSQQIYVTPVAWEAVRNLRDQNMLIINEVAALLPEDAKAVDLNKKLLEVIMSQNDQALHIIVLNALNFEAKKLM